MSEPLFPEFPAEFPGLYCPKPSDWLGRVVLSQTEATGLTHEQEALMAEAIGSAAVEETMHSLTVAQDDLTDNVLVEFVVSGHDREDALNNSAAAMFWGSTAVHGTLGRRFRIENMQLARVGYLQTSPGSTLGDLEFDSTEDCRMELQILADVQKLIGAES